MKQIAWTFLIAFDLAAAILWVQKREKNVAVVPSAVLSLIGSLVMCLLSFAEHKRSIRTSFILNFYLFFTTILDTARSRSYSLTSDLETISTLFTTRVGVKVFLAIVEARGKNSLILPEFAHEPAEATSGMYSGALFWWQNSLLKTGFSNVISVDDLFELDKHLRSDYLHHRLRSAWLRGQYSQPSNLAVGLFTNVTALPSQNCRRQLPLHDNLEKADVAHSSCGTPAISSDWI